MEGGGFLDGPGSRLVISDETAKRIDKEINDLLSSCYEEALRILKQELCLLKNLVEILLQVETLDGEEFEIIVYGAILLFVTVILPEGPAGVPGIVKGWFRK